MSYSKLKTKLIKMNGLKLDIFKKVLHLHSQIRHAQMAESVDALVSNTSGAIRAGSIPAPGTKNPRRMHSTRVLTFYFPHIPQLSYFWTVIIISGIHLKKIGSANHTILPAVKTALKKCISQRLIPSPALIGLSPQ